MRLLAYLLLLMSILLWSSCREDFESRPSTGQLEFSRDTVYLDTIFSNIGSSTYTLKVYNRSEETISIPNVGLEQGENSRYRLNVDGRAGQAFQDVEIRGRDSLFIFIETTVDIGDFENTNPQFLYTDILQFDSGTNAQEVPLITLIKDAVFLFPSRDAQGMTETLSLGLDDAGEEILIEGFFLEDDELVFTNEKPYVIYGYAAVPPNRTLEIQAGARVHFHESSGLIVANEGSLVVRGGLSTDQEAVENEVIFEGDRLEPEFADVPGQWGAIWLTAGSTGHDLNHLTIKNATVGLLMDSNDGGASPTLTLRNVQIYNSSNVGLLGRTANILGENVVINNSGLISLWASLGGTYNFTHSTFANYYTGGFRNFPAVVLDNQLQIDTEEFLVADLNANFLNCIVYGNTGEEFGLLANASAAFDFQFSNSLIRFDDDFDEFADNPLYDFSNTARFTNCLISELPDFKDPGNNALQIGENSAASGLGDAVGASQVPLDLLGTARSTTPDSGAYESVLFEEEPEN
ncbi:hypothetical protein [Croceiramulus getboli]|nr:hypothetical protein P8624_13860 [Flavobacteriaceae bacterium YJPT1-3]